MLAVDQRLVPVGRLAGLQQIDYLTSFPYLGTPGGGYQSKPGIPAAS